MSWDNVSVLATNTLKSVGDRMDLQNSPFETVFGAIVPTAALAAHPLLGIIFFVAEAFGVGPGVIGRIIDKAMGFKSGGVKPVLDMSTASAAARNILDFLTTKAGGLMSGAALTIDDAEIRRAANLCLVCSYSETFVKLGASKQYWKNFWRGVVGQKRGSRAKLGFVKVLTGLIWTFMKGFLALGVIGGITKTIAGKKETITNPASFIPGMSVLGIGGKKKETVEVPKSVPSSWLYYKNIKGDVQDTLIGYMNGRMPTFSNLFYKENKTQLYNSPQMRNLLGLIEKHNHAPVAHLNDKAGFVAPKIEVIMQRLMPGYKFSTVDTYKPTDKLEDLNEE